jgi:hypothetical protein
MGGFKNLFSAPKIKAPPPPPKPVDLEAEAEREAEEEARRLRKGRVSTVLTGGQGLAGTDGGVKTVLGG